MASRIKFALRRTSDQEIKEKELDRDLMSSMIVLSHQGVLHLFKIASMTSLESPSTYNFLKPLTFAVLKASRNKARASTKEMVHSSRLWVPA